MSPWGSWRLADKEASAGGEGSAHAHKTRSARPGSAYEAVSTREIAAITPSVAP